MVYRWATVTALCWYRRNVFENFLTATWRRAILDCRSASFMSEVTHLDYFKTWLVTTFIYTQLDKVIGRLFFFHLYQSFLSSLPPLPLRFRSSCPGLLAYRITAAVVKRFLSLPLDPYRAEPSKLEWGHCDPATLPSSPSESLAFVGWVGVCVGIFQFP